MSVGFSSGVMKLWELDRGDIFTTSRVRQMLPNYLLKNCLSQFHIKKREREKEKRGDREEEGSREGVRKREEKGEMPAWE